MINGPTPEPALKSAVCFDSHFLTIARTRYVPKPARSIRLSPVHLIQLLFTLCIVMGITACSIHPGTQKDVEASSNGIIKSPTDNRDYLAFQLTNQLQVLVISDPEVDKAAASLSVNVGSGSDPKDREGLAHFLEHMLFLGTEKYPEAGAYQQFISDHGGSHNAYTAFDETNYFFDVNAQDLEPTLDQFAQFFIAPLFNPEYVDREKHAVHSEYQAKIKDDSRLQYELIKTVSNPNHPFSQFSVGSLKILADRENQPVREDLLKFYQQHYSANRMTLVVLGKQSVTELKQLVAEQFAAVANHNSPLPSFEQPLFSNKQLPLRINTQPNKNLRQIKYLFPVASTRPHYQSKPVHYLSNLLGHEGKGSLLSYLKNQGWAENLSAGIGFEDNQQASLQISIGLTEQGLENTDAVTDALFQSINLIKQQGIEAWRYQEQAQLAELDFEFQENGSNMYFVTRLASRLKHVPTKQVLSAPYQMNDFQPQLISEYIAALNPQNMLMMVVGKDLAVDQSSQHYQAEYAVQRINAQLLQHWSRNTLSGDIQLPQNNPFIPAQLALTQPPETEPNKPQQQISEQGVSWWHSSDTTFKTPKADFYFTLRSPLANQSPLNVALTALYVKTVNEQLNEFSYPATLAGLSYQLYPHVRGISVRIAGYHDKQTLLLAEVLKALKNPIIEKDSFNRHRDELIRHWRNALKQKPYQQSMSQTSRLVTNPSWQEQQLIAALTPVTPEELKAFAQQFLNQLDIEVLGNGNISKSDMATRAKQLATQLVTEKPTQPIARPNVQQLPAGQKLLYPFEVEHSDNAVTLYVQGDNKDVATRARFALFNQILSTPFYHELRTRQQLGYIVFSSPMTLLEAPALAFTVQSPNTTSENIIRAIEDFISVSSTTLATLDEATLSTHKRALISRIMEKDVRLSQRSNRYWHEIDRQNVEFDSREQLVAAISAIDLGKLQQSYQQDFIAQPRQLVVLATANKEPLQLEDYQTVDQASLRKLSTGFVKQPQILGY